MNENLTKENRGPCEKNDTYEKPCLVEVYSCDIAHGESGESPETTQIYDNDNLE